MNTAKINAAWMNNRLLTYEARQVCELRPTVWLAKRIAIR